MAELNQGEEGRQRESVCVVSDGGTLLTEALAVPQT